MPLHCEIVSQDRQLFSGNVDMVIAPGVDGVVGILPNHAPLLTMLSAGKLRLRQADQELVFDVSGGVLHVSPEGVIVLADAAEQCEMRDGKGPMPFGTGPKL